MGSPERLSHRKKSRISALNSGIFRNTAYNLMYLNQLGKPLAETLYQAFIKAGWSDFVTFMDGGGNHLGIIAGPGANKAGALKAAIESTTRLRVSVDKPDQPEATNFVYLFVGINPAETN